jgi:hypothetical protein
VLIQDVDLLRIEGWVVKQEHEYGKAKPPDLPLPPDIRPALQGLSAPNIKATQDEWLFLLGHPALPPSNIRQQFLAQWQGAAAYFQTEPAISEAEVVENPETKPIPEEFKTVSHQLLAEPAFRASFQPVGSATIEAVDLEQLIIFQPHINLSHVTNIMRQFPVEPTPAQLFDFCMRPPVSPGKEARKTFDHNNKVFRFSYTSLSDDFRDLVPFENFHHQPEQGDGVPGYVTNVCGILLGHGTNCVTAWLVEHRLVLFNGSHRAYGLYERGIKREVPCVIWKLPSRDLMLHHLIHPNKGYYLSSQRPPMFKDYFNKRLTVKSLVPSHRRQVEITVSVRTADISGSAVSEVSTKIAKTPREKAAERRRQRRKARRK